MRTWRDKLYFDAMPGRYTPLARWQAEMRENGITTMVCLTPPEEITRESPDYAAWRAEQNDVDVTHIPIPDYGVPQGEDASRFWQTAAEVAELTESGTTVFIHCGAGHGRTGVFAVAVLMQLGLPYEDAYAQILAVGSEPERPEQREFLRNGGPQR